MLNHQARLCGALETVENRGEGEGSMLSYPKRSSRFLTDPKSYPLNLWMF